MTDTRWTVEDLGPRLEQFLRPLLRAARFSLDFEIVADSGIDPAFEQPDVTVRFHGHDVDLLLANKAELLLALEHVALEMLRAHHEEHSRLMFDAADYRVNRIEELRLSAETAAEQVRRTGAPFRFNPMNSRERRIIHLALRGTTAVRSESEGLGPRRQVVLYPVK